MSEQEDAEGLRCVECGPKHAEWEKMGRPYIPSEDASGRLQRIKCGNCGAVDEVGVP